MARLINNLPMPIGAERIRDNLPMINYTGGYNVDGYDLQSGIMNYTKEDDMKSFTIKPFSNSMLNLEQLMKYSTCTHTSSDDGEFFEKYGFGFRYDFNFLSGKNVTGTQLDIDLTNTGNTFKAGHTYTLSFYTTNGTNYSNAYLPDGNWAYGGNENEEGNKVYHSIINVRPEVMNWQVGEYITFTAEEDCAHLVYNPNTEFSKMNSKYTLYITGLVEGDKPSFCLPVSLGQHPIVSTCDDDIYALPNTGNTITRVTGGYIYERLSVDAVSIIQALDNAINTNKNIFKLDWR